MRLKAIRSALPWLFWTLLFAVLTTTGMRDGHEMTGATNPRSLTQSPATTRTVTSENAPCGGESLVRRDQLHAKR